MSKLARKVTGGLRLCKILYRKPITLDLKEIVELSCYKLDANSCSYMHLINVYQQHRIENMNSVLIVS